MSLSKVNFPTKTLLFIKDTLSLIYNDILTLQFRRSRIHQPQRPIR